MNLRLYTFILIWVYFSLVSFLPGVAQPPPWNDPNSLPQWLTEEETLRRNEIGVNFTPTPPPTGQIRNIAEFETMQGVLIRYPLGISLALVSSMSQHVIVYTLVANQTTKNQAINAYQNAGVNMANCQFIIAPTESYWTRDYGPWFIAQDNLQISIVDFIYNRPRPGDNAVPGQVATFLNIPAFGMDLVHTGGNYMTESHNRAASTNLILEENSLNQHQILTKIQNYLGVHTYHITIDPQNTYLKHIDTWAKFLDVDKILIAEVPSWHSQYAAHEAMAAYFAGQMSAYGHPYQVFRVYTPSGQPYTNSLIVNHRVYVPVTGSSWDQAALQVYQQAMPGYEVLGFTGSWQSTDALHCRVIGIADTGMFHISHIPLSGTLDYQAEYMIQADIIPYSQANLYADSLFIIYSANNTAFDTIPLFLQSGNTYTGNIPASAGDTLISYYLWAADASGRRQSFPFTAPAATRSFRINNPPVLQAKVFLEGPYLEAEMSTLLNQQGYLPGQQPYSGSPWHFQEESQAATINPQVVDWVLVSFRRASSATVAVESTTVKRKAALLLSDGTIVDTDGISPVIVDVEINNDLFLVIQHRNHLAVMSSGALQNINGVISWDFTQSFQSAYSPSDIAPMKLVANGLYGMFGGDGDANGQIQSQDKNNVWSPQAGNSGYYSGDFDMNGQVQTQDKNIIWESNTGTGTMVP